MRKTNDYSEVKFHQRIWMFASSLLWGPLYLLFQAVVLCGDGLMQMVTGSDRFANRLLGRLVCFLLGLPGLILFPLAVGIRGIGGLNIAVGQGIRSTARAGIVNLFRVRLYVVAVGFITTFFSCRLWPYLPEMLPGSLDPLILAITCGLLLGLLWSLFWALVSVLPDRPLFLFLYGALVSLLLPLWLPAGIVFWFLPWLIWQLLVPEFARVLKLSGGTRETRFVRFISLRYLFGRRETILHSATSYFAAGGIALGVCALIVVLAVMSGFNQEVTNRIVGTNAHVILLRFGGNGLANPDSLITEVKKHPEVISASPFVYGKAMLSAGETAEGVVVQGIAWNKTLATTSMGQYVRDYSGKSPLAPTGNGHPSIVLGVHIADNLGLLPGQELLLVSPSESRRTPMGFVPRMRRFLVNGIFDSGMYDYDATMSYISLEEAQSFFDLGDRVTGIEINITDMDAAPRVADEIVEMMGGFPLRANNWIDLNANLFRWVRYEKRVMFIILTMIILVAGFNIASSLIMMVMEKRREIGILKSMGASPMGILRIFVLEGWIMTFSGTAMGAIFGLALCYILKNYQLIALPEGLYFIDTLPINVEITDVVTIVGSVLVISILSTLYPAWKASQMDAIDAIHSD